MLNGTADVSDRFLGAWRVTEYVYDPDGTFRGIVRQHRRLAAAEKGGLRLIQTCKPEASLRHHPMQDFEGTWVFELQKNGQKRSYLGPDVIGAGRMWKEGWMTGEGVWPRFGYAFQSYAFMAAPSRQCTGGVFSRLHNTMASITGVATPEEEEWPSLDTEAEPAQLSHAWRGTLFRYDFTGALSAKDHIERSYKDATQYTERGEWFHGAVGLLAGGRVRAHRLEENMKGFWIRYGARWALQVFGEYQVYWTELLDVHTQTISVFRTFSADGRLSFVELAQLRAVQ